MGFRPPATPSSTCSPRSMPHGRTGSLPPDHNLDDYVDAPASHRHGGPLRVGLGGPGGPGETGPGGPPGPTPGAEGGPARVPQDHFTTPGAHLPPPHPP